MFFRRHLCVALAFLNVRSRDCEHCAVQDCMGVAMHRLKELVEHAQRISEQNPQAQVRRPEDDAA